MVARPEIPEAEGVCFFTGTSHQGVQSEQPKKPWIATINYNYSNYLYILSSFQIFIYIYILKKVGDALSVTGWLSAVLRCIILIRNAVFFPPLFLRWTHFTRKDGWIERQAEERAGAAHKLLWSRRGQIKSRRRSRCAGGARALAEARTRRAWAGSVAVAIASTSLRASHPHPVSWSWMLAACSRLTVG